MRSDYYDGGDLARAADQPVNMPKTIYVQRGVTRFVITSGDDPLAVPYRRIDLVRRSERRALPHLWWLIAGINVGFFVGVILGATRAVLP